MEAMRATADSLKLTIEHMTLVERLRRSGRGIPDVDPRDAN